MSYIYYEENSKYVEQYNDFLKTRKVNTDILDSNFLAIRNFVVDKYNFLKNNNYKDYKLDVELSLAFRDFLLQQDDFDDLVETDLNFYKFIALFVIPDIIADRFSAESKLHYFKLGRCYPYALYWFANLTWQGTYESTKEVLKEFSTDDIVQLCERPSRIGINVQLFRTMSKYLSNYIRDNRTKRYYINGKLKGNIVRNMMKLNTSKLMVTRPEIYPGEIEGYVKMLFNIIGVKI